MALCVIPWSVTPPGQDWLELNPDVRWLKYPAGVERAGGGKREAREALFDWMDRCKEEERKKN